MLEISPGRSCRNARLIVPSTPRQLHLAPRSMTSGRTRHDPPVFLTAVTTVDRCPRCPACNGGSAAVDRRWPPLTATVEPPLNLLVPVEASVYECGVNLLLGTCLNCTYGDGKPVTCCGCEGPLRGGFCSFCASRDGNSFDYNPNPNSFNKSQKFSDYPPQPRCMALLLAEERFLKIKQAMEEEHNQPGVMQELLLKLMDDLQILKGSQQEKKETAA
ncbi:hypothetical protein Tco_0679294 [Tanacetum coccineum]|uniref:Uncharacterized protein n=1 Tax=Tanacetum coccineum TaxID=301880 RepID=A0ABQ4XI76_9ASTR